MSFAVLQKKKNNLNSTILYFISNHFYKMEGKEADKMQNGQARLLAWPFVVSDRQLVLFPDHYLRRFDDGIHFVS
jgi:hypothetical protein